MLGQQSDTFLVNFKIFLFADKNQVFTALRRGLAQIFCCSQVLSKACLVNLDSDFG